MLTGPAGAQLGTEPSSLPHRLGPVTFELGIIAGDCSLNPWFSAWLPGPDDGKVTVNATRVDGMLDFLVVHASHTWMMWQKQVARLVKEFLRSGSFPGCNRVTGCG
jgi:hypothetical protein